MKDVEGRGGWSLNGQMEMECRVRRAEQRSRRTALPSAGEVVVGSFFAGRFRVASMPPALNGCRRSPVARAAWTARGRCAVKEVARCPAAEVDDDRARGASATTAHAPRQRRTTKQERHATIRDDQGAWRAVRAVDTSPDHQLRLLCAEVPRSPARLQPTILQTPRWHHEMSAVPTTAGGGCATSARCCTLNATIAVGERHELRPYGLPFGSLASIRSCQP